MISCSVTIPSGMKTRVFVLGRGVLSEIPAVLAEYFTGRRPWIIADGNTFAAAGKQVENIFAGKKLNSYPSKIFPGTPQLHPLTSISEALGGEIPDDAVPVAVGSGVINDIVKHASGIKRVPYLCVPTAASVDGYTSAGAAMMANGFKKTCECPPPAAIVADLNVLESAPAPMLAGGYADLFSKVTAGGEWLIADALGFEPIVDSIWELVQKPLRRNLSNSRDVEFVFQGLAATGYSMQLYRDSRPASGSEHMFSHIWEMEGLKLNGNGISHGFQVGVATLAVIRLMDFVVKTPLELAHEMATPILSRTGRTAEIDRLLIRGCYGAAHDTALEKMLDGESAVARRELIFSKWDEIGRRLALQLYPVDEAERMLREAGAPTRYDQIGLSREQFMHAPRAAQLIRKRYTVLDLLYESGLFDAALKVI